MRPRKPDVERDEPGLRAEADESQGEDGVARPRRERTGRRAKIAEASRAARLEEQESAEKTGEAELGHGEIPLAGAHDLRLVRLGHHEEVGAERHALPDEKEGQRPVGERDEAHRQEEDVQHEADLAERGTAIPRPRVARAVERRRRGNQARQGKEDGAQGVEGECHAAHGPEETRRVEGKCRAPDARARRQREAGRGAGDRAQSPTATTSLGSGVASYVFRSGTSMFRVTGPVTRRRSAWRGEATKWKPNRSLS